MRHEHDGVAVELPRQARRPWFKPLAPDD